MKSNKESIAILLGAVLIGGPTLMAYGTVLGPRDFEARPTVATELKAMLAALHPESQGTDDIKNTKKPLFSDEMKAALKDFDKQFSQELTNYDASYNQTVKEWEHEAKEFFAKVNIYKRGLANIPVSRIISSSLAGRPIKSSVDRPFHFVASSFYQPIRDQSERSTCTAFAAIRAIEIMLAQNSFKTDLSEQYFYWLSRPECQQKKCSQGGSWVIEAFKASQEGRQLSIPLESTCAYNYRELKGNETQIPLEQGCTKGKTKVLKYSELDTLDQFVDVLNANKPVIAAFRLTENFFHNTGWVGFEGGDDVSNREHSQGHALLLTGYIKLPEHLRKSQGKLCFIAANSWGPGWGRGGYSCLTEAWVRKYRFTIPFVSVEAIEI